MYLMIYDCCVDLFERRFTNYADDVSRFYHVHLIIFFVETILYDVSMGFTLSNKRIYG